MTFLPVVRSVWSWRCRGVLSILVGRRLVPDTQMAPDTQTTGHCHTQSLVSPTNIQHMLFSPLGVDILLEGKGSLKNSHFHLTEENMFRSNSPTQKTCLFIQYEPFPNEVDIPVSVCIDCTKCNICNICSYIPPKFLAANPAPHIQRFRGGPLHWYVGGEILTCEKSPWSFQLLNYHI